MCKDLDRQYKLARSQLVNLGEEYIAAHAFQVFDKQNQLALPFVVGEHGPRKRSFWKEERAFLYLTGYVSEE